MYISTRLMGLAGPCGVWEGPRVQEYRQPNPEAGS